MCTIFKIHSTSFSINFWGMENNLDIKPRSHACQPKNLNFMFDFFFSSVRWQILCGHVGLPIPAVILFPRYMSFGKVYNLPRYSDWPILGKCRTMHSTWQSLKLLIRIYRILTCNVNLTHIHLRRTASEGSFHDNLGY